VPALVPEEFTTFDGNAILLKNMDAHTLIFDVPVEKIPPPSYALFPLKTTPPKSASQFDKYKPPPFAPAVLPIIFTPNTVRGLVDGEGVKVDVLVDDTRLVKLLENVPSGVIVAVNVCVDVVVPVALTVIVPVIVIDTDAVDVKVDVWDAVTFADGVIVPEGAIDPETEFVSECVKVLVDEDVRVIVELKLVVRVPDGVFADVLVSVRVPLIVALLEAAAGAFVPVPVSVGVLLLVPVIVLLDVTLDVTFVVIVEEVVIVRVIVCVFVFVAVPVFELLPVNVFVELVVRVPVIDLADVIVCVVVCEFVIAAVEFAVFETVFDPVHDVDTVLLWVFIIVTLDVKVGDIVEDADGRSSLISVASTKRTPASKQLSIAPPPPFRPAELCAATRLEDIIVDPWAYQAPPSLFTEQFNIVRRFASTKAESK
jgi:hypothetical protein